MLLATIGTAVFVAARDIDASEELCISYIDNSVNVTERQELLKLAYGFTCRCQACVEDVQKSDPLVDNQDRDLVHPWPPRSAHKRNSEPKQSRVT